MPASELVGRPVLRTSPRRRPGRPRAEEALRAGFAGREISGLELEMRRRDGGPLWVSVWMRPLRGADGRIPAVHSIWVDITDRVLAEAERARLQQQNLYLQEEIKSVHNFEEIVGRVPALLAVLDKVSRVAPTDATVLITGETGTGKELIARAIHSHSRRAAKPLIKVNCAALPAGLVESELFGHEKGAFTGAIARRIGRFELADGGTIFLDEIGELPAGDPGQAPPRPAGARDSSASAAARADPGRRPDHRRHQPRPAQGRPRPGRSARTSTTASASSRSRSRRSASAPRTSRCWCGSWSTSSPLAIGKRIDGVSRETMRRLVAYPWPGNVRELENVLERAVILATGPTLDLESRRRALPPAPPTPAADLPAPSLEAVERRHILAVLRQTQWVIDGPRGAAQVLGLHPNTLRSRLKKLGITRSSHEPS